MSSEIRKHVLSDEEHARVAPLAQRLALAYGQYLVDLFVEPAERLRSYNDLAATLSSAEVGEFWHMAASFIDGGAAKFSTPNLSWYLKALGAPTGVPERGQARSALMFPEPEHMPSPHDALAAMLMDQDACDLGVKMLCVDNMGEHALPREAFRAMVRLRRQGVVCDPLTLAAEMCNPDTAFGGLGADVADRKNFVGHLVDRWPSDANSEDGDALSTVAAFATIVRLDWPTYPPTGQVYP